MDKENENMTTNYLPRKSLNANIRKFIYQILALAPTEKKDSQILLHLNPDVWLLQTALCQNCFLALELESFQISWRLIRCHHSSKSCSDRAKPVFTKSSRVRLHCSCTVI